MNARLFTALWPDAAVRAQLAAFRDAWAWPPGARPVVDENLHATLHFIGAFPRERMAALRGALGGVALEPLSLRLAGTEVWRAGTAVARLDADPGLLDLHARLGATLARIGVVLDERAFAPHVTMARRAARAGPPALLPELAWRATGFALVESHGGSQAAYELLKTWGAGEITPP